MWKDDLVYVGHMLDVARSICQKVSGITLAQFNADENLRLALTHLLQIIGGAACRVSPAFQQSHPQIPWKDIIGMRHRLVHDYIHVDYDLVWETATLDVQPLLVQLEKIVPPDTPGNDSTLGI
jgi:uncharacterized protein with HEPN domain